ncbi:MAG: carboxypeptidase-like regulatory domain-containing protein [Candidatus Eisenbacteria bacterium]|nr:carboxypeptidase-like regulatory domain-containing protein [Candidatus Eisenbacteria bacterium]
MRPPRSAVLISLPVFMLLAAFLAAAGSSASFLPPPTEQVPPKEEKTEQQKKFLRIGEDTKIFGRVSDAQDRSLSGISVELFVGGLAAGSAMTDEQGSYSFSIPIDYGKNETIALWFVSKNTRLIHKLYILKESKSAKEHKLLSPCVPRLELTPSTLVNAQMLDAQMRIKQVSLSNCLKP